MTVERCVVIGSSKSNQRIEQWWRWARQRGCQSWMDTFAELEMTSGDPINVDLARFCFMALIQQDLDNLRAEWNQHTVRQHRQSGTPCGKPDIMFHLPRLYDTVDYKVEVDLSDVENIIREWCVS
ncbi:uncharacterized protein LOC117319292 [Pecten maximus]|uniref:uncharacterized protein LOC117319292 n=1 Tax=Pecten maximus TaxID=6579 RepID=UPI0014583EDC|nr:uncharacterized protein LOC117319292 [Pecten maximus]